MPVFSFRTSVVLALGLVSGSYGADLKAGDVCSIVGGPSSGFVDGGTTVARFSTPTGISLMKKAANGQKLLIADRGNHAIRGVDVKTGDTETLAGSGSSGFADGVGSNAMFNNPGDIESDGKDQYAYICDTENHQIRGLTLNTNEVFEVVGESQGDAVGFTTSARFDTPEGIAVSFDGKSAYVTDGRNNKIKKVNLDTKEVTLVAGTGTIGSQDGVGTVNVTFSHPRGITFSHDESALYIADTGNGIIRKITISSGVVEQVASTHSFSEPYDIVADDDGTYLYVAEASSDEIKKIDISRNTATTLTGDDSGDVDGSSGVAKFDGPRGLAIVDDDRMIVADAGNSKFRIVQLKDDDNKDFSTLCGLPLDVPDKEDPTVIDTGGDNGDGSSATRPEYSSFVTVVLMGILSAFSLAMY